MTVTRFEDTYTGGEQKLEYEYIYIQAPFQKAIDAFTERFGRDPRLTTCQCCGMDYDIETFQTLEEASGFERDGYWVDGEFHDEPRDPAYSQYIELEDWLERDGVLYIDSV